MSPTSILLLIGFRSEGKRVSSYVIAERGEVGEEEVERIQKKDVSLISETEALLRSSQYRGRYQIQTRALSEEEIEFRPSPVRTHYCFPTEKGFKGFFGAKPKILHEGWIS